MIPGCPYCEQELDHTDIFGLLAAHPSGEKYGDIYRCGNEDCEAYQAHFYSYDADGEIREGYPC